MNDLQELGSVFYRARLQKNLSLEELEQQTKIRLRFLHAIEEGNFDEAPGEVYLRGFLRSYAKAVDLDPEQVLIQYEQLSGRGFNGSVTPQDVQTAENPAPLSSPRLTARQRRARQRRRQRFAAAVLLAVAVALAALYYFRDSLGF